MFRFIKSKFKNLGTSAPDPKPAEANSSAEANSPTKQSENVGWFASLKRGLARSSQRLGQLFTKNKISDEFFEELETALIQSDVGTSATDKIMLLLKQRVSAAKLTEVAELKLELQNIIANELKNLEKEWTVGANSPHIIMVVGINGSGKTTSIGKLTTFLTQADYSVLLVAGDTFRAAAQEQLQIWATRNNTEIYTGAHQDPSSLCFDAVKLAKTKNYDTVLIDTAGRLVTQSALMNELKKVKRVIAKAEPSAPHEVIMIVDGNNGQNILPQVQAFDEAVDLSGLIITKLDGTAKGGMLIALALWGEERKSRKGSNLPVYFIGIGEKLEDLRPFNAREFAQALID